jgi:hypothetical protein
MVRYIFFIFVLLGIFRLQDKDIREKKHKVLSKALQFGNFRTSLHKDEHQVLG